MRSRSAERTIEKMWQILPEQVRRDIARRCGWFWLPCPICEKHFSGAEWLPDAVLRGDEDEKGKCVCPGCRGEAIKRNASRDEIKPANHLTFWGITKESEK